MLFPVCNHRPERAPKIFGKTFFLCWRCTGAIVGGAIALCLHRYFEYHSVLLFLLCCVPAVLDWMSQRYTAWVSFNILRFVTGTLLGLSVFFLL